MNNIENTLKTLGPKNFVFIPTKDFYKDVNIKRKRWAQILRNEVQPDLNELHSIADYFHVDIKKLI